jgi:hypothetical protein
LNHPLGLKWKLSELEMDQDSGSTKDFWEKALANLKKARAKVGERYNAGR